MFKSSFDKYDVDGSGQITNHELQVLLEGVFPADVATSAKMRPYLFRLLREVDEDGNGQIDFPDFLRLMRAFYDLQEQDRLIREQQVIRETGFARSEVEEFRELFINYAASTGEGDESRSELTLPEVKRIIANICPLGTKRIIQLSDIFKEMATEEDEDGKRSLHFPEFLLLMRRLLDVNFAGIREQSEKVVSKVAEHHS